MFHWNISLSANLFFLKSDCCPTMPLPIAQVWKLRNDDYHLRWVLDVQLVYFLSFTFVAIFFSPKICVGGGSQKDPTEGWKWLNCAAFLLDYHHNNKRCCCERFHIRWKLLLGTGTRSLLQISEFVLDKKLQQNASKFAIFYIFENPKVLFLLFISCYFIFLPNECPGLCRHKPGHS